MNQPSDALTYTRRAVSLLKEIKRIQDDSVSGDDTTADSLEAILKAFTDVEAMVEERYKKPAKMVEELPDQ